MNQFLQEKKIEFPSLKEDNVILRSIHELE